MYNMLYKISNNVDDIKDLLIKLKMNMVNMLLYLILMANME
jgi:hypothetical protein